MDMVWLEAECSRYEFFGDVIAQTHPEIAVVAMDASPEKALELVAKLSQIGARVQRAGRQLQHRRQPDPAGHAGRRQGVPAAADPHRGPARRPVPHGRAARLEEQEASSRGSTVIAVCGATGGVGTTSLAVNLGCALAKDPDNTVALVDLDLCLGDADVFLDTIPDYTLVDVAQNVTRLDFTLLKRSLTKHSSGLYLLPRPVQMEDIQLIQPDDVQRVIGLLKATFTHLVIDLSKSYSAIDMVALKAANHILLVTQMDLPCLRNVVRLLMSFGEMEEVADKIKIVVNRVGLDDGSISLKKAQETVGREVFWQLPNDYRTMVEVRNNGVPLVEQAPKAAITQSVIMLAEKLSGTQKDPAEPEAEAAKGSSSIGRFLPFFGKAKPAGK